MKRSLRNLALPALAVLLSGCTGAAIEADAAALAGLALALALGGGVIERRHRHVAAH